MNDRARLARSSTRFCPFYIGAVGASDKNTYEHFFVRFVNESVRNSHVNSNLFTLKRKLSDVTDVVSVVSRDFNH